MTRVLFACFLIAVAFIGALWSDSVDNQLHGKLMEVITECNKTHTVDMNDIVVYNQTGKLSEDPKFKCMLRCMMENLQLGTEEDGFDPAKVAIGLEMIRITRPDKSKFYEIAVNCANKPKPKGPGKCENSYQFSKCVIQSELKINGPV